MNDRYLWDRSGPPDPEIEALERTLAPLALGARPAVSRRDPAAVPARRVWSRVAAAAALLVVAGGLARFAVPRSEPTAWQLAGLPIRRGQVLRTDSPVRIEAESVGRVDIAAGSELLASGDKRLQLRRGELRAFIWAPAREFVVDTPSARAVDLGCQYTLQVDDRGDGLLKVSMGWVAFENNGRESFIPAGAQCRTRKRSGPGIPWFEDSAPAFHAALAGWEDAAPGALDGVLKEAAARDGLSLWHLLTRVPPAERGRVFDRFAQLVPVSGEATRDAVLRGDPKALDAAWNALGLENTGWWRNWERHWSQ